MCPLMYLRCKFFINNCIVFFKYNIDVCEFSTMCVLHDCERVFLYLYINVYYNEIKMSI